MIEVQKGRKLKIKNESIFIEKLYNINYFDLINGFETLLLLDKKDKSKGYRKRVTSNDYFRLYSFDRELNKTILKTLGEFEIALKTKISHYFSRLYYNSTHLHSNCLDKNYYRCPSHTSYNGKYLSDSYNFRFILFQKYELRNGKYRRDSSGTYNYADFIKNKVPYIGRYNSPPLWVLIKQLTFGDVTTMTGLLKKDVMDLILADYKLSTGDREFLLNCLDVFRELRNHCAHFELVNRFRTPGSLNLKIINGKISINHKSPINIDGDVFRIPLFDTLKILKIFVPISNIVDDIIKFYYNLLFRGKMTIAKNLIERMGNENISDWKKLKYG